MIESCGTLWPLSAKKHVPSPRPNCSCIDLGQAFDGGQRGELLRAFLDSRKKIANSEEEMPVVLSKHQLDPGLWPSVGIICAMGPIEVKYWFDGAMVMGLLMCAMGIVVASTSSNAPRIG